MGKILNWIGWVWAQIRDVWVGVMPIRFSILAVALVGLAFGFTSQGQDALRLAGETRATLVQVMFPLAVTLLALMSWYWSRQFLRIHHDRGGQVSRWVRDWAPRLLGGMAFLVVGLDVVKALRQYGPGAAPLALYVYAWVLSIAAPVFVWLAYKRRDWLEAAQARAGAAAPAPAKVLTLRALLREAPVLLGLLLTFAAALFLAATFAPQRLGLLGAPTIVALSAALWVPFGGMIVHLGYRRQLPVLSTLFVLAFAFSECNDNHVVLPIAPLPRAQRPNVTERYRAWSKALTTKYGASPQPVFIVVTEGGGIRAAYWTAAVLTALHDQLPHFSDHVFAISGVSGGSVGATTYAALLATPSLARQRLRPEALHALRSDALAPTLAAMLQPDLAQRFLPWPVLPDRAAALEGAWEYGWRSRAVTGTTMAERFKLWLHRSTPVAPPPHLDDGFLKVFGAKNETLFPSLFLNSTIVEKGARAIVSNLRIDSWRLKNRADDPEPSEFASAYDVLAELEGDVKISTAAHFSARFPYVSPAGTIRAPHFGSKMLPRPKNESTCVDCGDSAKPAPCRSCNENCCHLVDGGYFENSGAVTAAEIIATVRQAGGPANLFPVVLLISATKSPLPPYVPQQRVGEVTTPPTALYDARDGRGDLAVAQLKRAMAAPVLQLPHSYIDFVLTERATVLPLGWALAEQSRNVIDASVGLRHGPNWDAFRDVQRLVGDVEPPQSDTIACAAYAALPSGEGGKDDIPVTGSVSCPTKGAAR